tara:strand:+ start:439 stop:2178 length:1740 start_codon:yes stop_codon:yes gene_type:complete
MYKTVSLERADIQSIVGAAANDYDGQVAIVPVTKRGMSNTTVSSGSGDYDGGDRVIGFGNGYEIDGDLLLTVGWGDGFAIRRLNDDGTMTRLFYDSQFLWRDTTSTYNHLQSVAIDKVNKLGVVMTYNVEGYTTFDYSGCVDGGTTFVKDPRPTHSLPDVFIGSQDIAGGYVNRVGGGYYSGLCAAGEWIYAADHDSHHYKKVMRRNLRTGVEERLATNDTNVMYPGSAAEDRNGYRGKCFYDEVNDRVLNSRFYNANFVLIVDASTANPKTVWCDMGDAGQGDDGYEHGWFIPDPVNEPNVFWTGCNSRFTKMDVTPCFSGNTATILDITYVNGTAPGNNYSIEFRAGSKYKSAASGQPTDRMPGYPNFMPTAADRGRAMNPGWVDFDNNRMVTLYRYNNTTEDTTSLGRGRSYRQDYGNPVVRMYSANGTPWWISTGYGADGHGFRIWNDTYKNELIENWEVRYGDYALPNAANIDFVFWNKLNYFVPSECSLTFYVSNNEGATWETYSGTETEEHNFSSTGNTLICKIVANGNPSKNAYKMSNGPDTILFGTKYASEMDSSINNKMTRFKLKGKKI